MFEELQINRITSNCIPFVIRTKDLIWFKAQHVTFCLASHKFVLSILYGEDVSEIYTLFS